MEWQTIDTAPKTGFFVAYSVGEPPFICWWNKHSNAWESRSSMVTELSEDPTHWLPLVMPEFPQENK